MLNFAYARFTPCSNVVTATEVWQWDYGQKLRVEGLELPLAVEVQLSLSESGGTTITRVGSTVDGVMTCAIPDSLFENGATALNYNIFAFIYLTSAESGETEYKIIIPVKARPQPEVRTQTDSGLTLDEAVNAVNGAAEDAQAYAALAESWAVGGTGTRPGEDYANSMYYAEMAKQAATEKGFVSFEIVYPGILHMYITENLTSSIDFEINSNGELEVHYL